MAGKLDCRRLSGCAAAAALLSFALVAAGCSSSSFTGAPSAAAPPAASSSFGITSFFTGSSAKAPQGVAGATSEFYCPPVQVREGASTLTIAPPGNNSTMSVQYQASFIREGRQCAVAGGDMVMKVGVQGRVLVGPAGGPGEVDVPLRIAVVNETPSGTTPIATKFIRMPVVVASKDDSPLFTHIEDAMSFPMPSSATLYTYKVYVGFDPLTAAMQDKEKEKAKLKARPRRHRPKRKPKPQPTADSN
jgi:hypothetical protein